MKLQETIEIDVSSIRLKFKHDIEYFKEYNEFNRQRLNERQKMLNDYLESDIRENPNSEEVLVQIYNDDYKRIPAYFYHSSIISLFSLLEYFLNQICSEIISATRTPIQLTEINGNSIPIKARIFLNKMCSIEMESRNKELIQIGKFQKIRNMIVHQNSYVYATNGVISESPDYKTLSEYKEIEINLTTGKFLITTHDLIVTFCEVINKYVHSIIGEIEKKKFKFFGLDYEKYQREVYYNNYPEGTYLTEFEREAAQKNIANDFSIDDLPF